MNWSLLVLFSAATLSYSALACCARACSRFWKASSAGFSCSAVSAGFVDQVAGTNRWRLGVAFVRIAVTVGVNLNRAKAELEELSQRYAVPANQVERYTARP